MMESEAAAEREAAFSFPGGPLAYSRDRIGMLSIFSFFLPQSAKENESWPRERIFCRLPACEMIEIKQNIK